MKVNLHTPQQDLTTGIVGEFYSPNTSMDVLKYMTGYGRIFWNLSVRTQYLLGFELGCRIIIANTTNKARSYLVKAKTIGSNGVIAEGIVLINGEQWFTLEAGQTLELLGSLTLDVTDCLLELDLYENTADEVVSNCVTYLYPQEAGAEMLLESMAMKNIVSSISGAMTNMITIMMIAGIGVIMIKGAK